MIACCIENYQSINRISQRISQGTSNCEGLIQNKTSTLLQMNFSRSRVPSITPERNGQMCKFVLFWREATLKLLALFNTKFAILTAEKSSLTSDRD